MAWDGHWKTPAFAYALRQASLNHVLPKQASQVGDAGLRIARKMVKRGEEKIQLLKEEIKGNASNNNSTPTEISKKE